jgi:hypothetical protein
MHRPTAGSSGRAFSYKRGTPVRLFLKEGLLYAPYKKLAPTAAYADHRSRSSLVAASVGVHAWRPCWY